MGHVDKQKGVRSRYRRTRNPMKYMYENLGNKNYFKKEKLKIYNICTLSISEQIFNILHIRSQDLKPRT